MQLQQTVGGKVNFNLDQVPAKEIIRDVTAMVIKKDLLSNSLLYKAVSSLDLKNTDKRLQRLCSVASKPVLYPVALQSNHV